MSLFKDTFLLLHVSSVLANFFLSSSQKLRCRTFAGAIRKGWSRKEYRECSASSGTSYEWRFVSSLAGHRHMWTVHTNNNGSNGWTSEYRSAINSLLAIRLDNFFYHCEIFTSILFKNTALSWRFVLAIHSDTDAYCKTSNPLTISSVIVYLLTTNCCFIDHWLQVHQSGSGWSPIYVEDNLAVMSVGFLLPRYVGAPSYAWHSIFSRIYWFWELGIFCPLEI